MHDTPVGITHLGILVLLPLAQLGVDEVKALDTPDM